jgi:hypothetical protein
MWIFQSPKKAAKQLRAALVNVSLPTIGDPKASGKLTDGGLSDVIRYQKIVVEGVVKSEQQRLTLVSPNPA